MAAYLGSGFLPALDGVSQALAAVVAVLGAVLVVRGVAPLWSVAPFAVAAVVGLWAARTVAGRRGSAWANSITSRNRDRQEEATQFLKGGAE